MTSKFLLEMRQARRLRDERVRFLQQGDDADPHGSLNLRSQEARLSNVSLRFGF